jgi:hypothetical protein
MNAASSSRSSLALCLGALGLGSLLALSSAACGSGGSSSGTTSGGETPDPGALVKATMKSQVAVVLDEIPVDRREAIAAALQAKGEAFWIARAKAQVNMTKYRLAYRTYYYTEGNRMQLPLPPDSLWKVTLVADEKGSTTPRRAMVGAHDVVMVDYAFESTLLTTLASPGTTEPELAEVGGVWDEPFILPVDPELLFQRTGYACMDEVGFPPNSVDSEETAVFYDQECEAQGELSKTACHQTALPNQSCIEALDASVGKVETQVHFERLAWDDAVADAARFGEVSNQAGPDIRAGVHSEIFPAPKVIYRYIPEGDCTLAEKCVGAPGWRRLLQFSSVNWNTGSTTLEIGAVDYLVSGMGGGDLAAHGIYELSECHQHYHFMHYGTFTYGNQEMPSSKRGFCLQSTDRFEQQRIDAAAQPLLGLRLPGHRGGLGRQLQRRHRLPVDRRDGLRREQGPGERVHPRDLQPRRLPLRGKAGARRSRQAGLRADGVQDREGRARRSAQVRFHGRLGQEQRAQRGGEAPGRGRELRDRALRPRADRAAAQLRLHEASRSRGLRAGLHRDPDVQRRRGQRPADGALLREQQGARLGHGVHARLLARQRDHHGGGRAGDLHLSLTARRRRAGRALLDLQLAARRRGRGHARHLRAGELRP